MMRQEDFGNAESPQMKEQRWEDGGKDGWKGKKNHPSYRKWVAFDVEHFGVDYIISSWQRPRSSSANERKAERQSLADCIVENQS